MEYDDWWGWVHRIRTATEDLMREFFFTKADYEAMRMYMRWHSDKKLLMKYEKIREKMMMLSNWAIELLGIIDKAIREGTAIPEDVRMENYEHLMMRLRQARESVEKVIEYARQNGFLTNLKDGLKTTK